MEASSTIYERRIQRHPAYALIDALAGVAAAAWRRASAWAAAYSERRAQSRARHELQNLNDHFLKDIGLERGDVDRLFR